MTGWHLIACLLATSGSWLAEPARAAEQPAVLRTAQGPAGAADLVEVVVGQQVTVRSADQPTRQIPWQQFVLWGRYADSRQSARILLTDGSLLVADLLRLDDQRLVAAGRLWAETSLPSGAVRAIMFEVPIDTATRDRLSDRLLQYSGPEGRLLLTNGDEIAGQLAAPIRPQPGAFFPSSLSWQLDPQSPATDIPLDRVVALVLPAAERPNSSPPDRPIVVGFRDGSRLRARGIQRVDRQLRVQWSDSLALETEPVALQQDDPWQAVTFVQRLEGPVTYLSDLQPLGYACTPYLDLAWPYHADRSVTNTWLRHNGWVYIKGLGMHSNCRLAYQLDGRYRWFETELAIDQQAGRYGSVVFRVFVQDDQGNWTSAASSSVVRGEQELQRLRVDVSQAQRMALVVDFADRTDQWDHANWLNARLIP